MPEARPMRIVITALALTLSASAAVAQTSPASQNPAAYFNNLKPVDAARLNHAAQSDPRARASLDEAEKKLNEANHPAGKMLEKTR
jgi:hypothetical protein